MSHYGPPPPEEPGQPDEHSDEQPGQSSAPGAHAGDPAAYNPYPDNWDAPKTGSGAFVAGAPPDGPYAASNPYGQPGPYGQPSPYAQTGPGGVNPYAGNPNPDKPTFGFGGYAGWLARVGAYLIDYILGLLAAIPAVFGYVLLLTDATTTTDPAGVKHVHFHQTGATAALIGIGALTGLAFQIWNLYIRQGRTGASIGKSVLAIRLVNSDFQPIGPGWCFLRSLLHILDALPCYLGFLWPICDSQKQTFADKILSTYVISATTPQPRAY
jgi:uncharacterized RDD family membrane protein YckC